MARGELGEISSRWLDRKLSHFLSLYQKKPKSNCTVLYKHSRRGKQTRQAQRLCVTRQKTWLLQIRANIQSNHNSSISIHLQLYPLSYHLTSTPEQAKSPTFKMKDISLLRINRNSFVCHFPSPPIKYSSYTTQAPSRTLSSNTSSSHPASA